jgi:hypothetical protein
MSHSKIFHFYGDSVDLFAALHRQWSPLPVKGCKTLYMYAWRSRWAFAQRGIFIAPHLLRHAVDMTIHQIMADEQYMGQIH